MNHQPLRRKCRRREKSKKSSGLNLVILVEHERRKEKIKANIYQDVRWNKRVVGSRMILKTVLNQLIENLLQLLEIRELRFQTWVQMVTFLYLVHPERPTDLILILSLFMGQTIIITIGYQHLVILTIQLLIVQAYIIITMGFNIWWFW